MVNYTHIPTCLCPTYSLTQLKALKKLWFVGGFLQWSDSLDVWIQLPSRCDRMDVSPGRASTRWMFTSKIPDAPWCWNLYLHLPFKWHSFVGKYSSTMEHMGHFKTNQQQRFVFFFWRWWSPKKWHKESRMHFEKCWPITTNDIQRLNIYPLVNIQKAIENGHL